MVVIVFFLTMIVVLVFLGIAAEKRWIKLPDNPEVTKLIAVVGVPVLFAILFVVVLFPIKIYSVIAENGIWYFMSIIAVILGLLILVFALGYGYFRIRRKQGSSTIQEINLRE